VKYTMIDDHVPFARRGIPSIDIIDFDYPYWHTVADTADKVSSDSLERVGRTLQMFLESAE
jgi:glutaminyl-peptide cyclotransferase